MAYAQAEDGVRLYYEEAGEGVPVVFVHEFAGDHRSWEPQMRFFSRRHRCITYSARGYPPSDVPAEVARYSQARAAADIAAVMDGAGIERAHVVGLSMGAFATLLGGLPRGLLGFFPDPLRGLRQRLLDRFHCAAHPFLDPAGRFALRLAVGDHRRREQSGAERDESSGQRIPLGAFHSPARHRLHRFRRLARPAADALFS